MDYPLTIVTGPTPSTPLASHEDEVVDGGSPPERPPRRRLKRALRLLGLVVTIALVGTWALLLRPPFLGGDTSYVIVSGTSMDPTLKTGDLVVVRRRPAYRNGDVVAFRIPKGDGAAGAKVIHRIIGGSAKEGFILQGDNKPSPDIWRPKPDDVLGKQWLHLPGFGRYLVRAREPLPLAILAALIVFITVVTWGLSSSDEDEDDDEGKDEEDEEDEEKDRWSHQI